MSSSVSSKAIDLSAAKSAAASSGLEAVRPIWPSVLALGRGPAAEPSPALCLGRGRLLIGQDSPCRCGNRYGSNLPDHKACYH
jgi:hypothetical protein